MHYCLEKETTYVCYCVSEFQFALGTDSTSLLAWSFSLLLMWIITGF